ncbi:MAG: SpoIIE family protein phosphatase [Epsilonproteobacteria bacterium]|nr:SpoIIE family protein phosphatase [Campylobacterota bacterium]
MEYNALKQEGIFLGVENLEGYIQTSEKNFLDILNKHKKLLNDKSYIITDGFIIIKKPIKDFKSRVVAYVYIGEKNQVVKDLINLNNQSLVNLLIALSVLAVVLFLLFFSVVKIVVVNPLDKMLKILDGNSHKNANEKEQEIDIYTEDEFGDISKILNQNIKQREEMQEEIKELMKVVDENVLIVKLDKEGNIIDATKKFYQSTHYTLDELKKMNITDLILSQVLRENLIKALKNKQNVEFEAELKTSGNTTMWIKITLTPHKAKNGDEFVMISFDITDKKMVEELNRQIRQSIEYALLIQKAILIEEAILKKHFRDAFIIWEPRDIVSGDVYFFEEINENEFIIMVIDCTSHGVPGAFVTMVVKAIEKEIATKIKLKELEPSPAKILSYFNKEIKELFSQFDKSNAPNVNVGFDGGIIYFNKKSNELRFSGAYTSLFLVRGSELDEIKGNRHSVGYKINDFESEYKEHIIFMNPKERFYVTTDGLLDQLGGDKCFPFGKKRFKNLIKTSLPLQEQKELIISEIKKYMGDEPQTDDITVVGVEI